MSRLPAYYVEEVYMRHAKEWIELWRTAQEIDVGMRMSLELAMHYYRDRFPHHFKKFPHLSA